MTRDTILMYIKNLIDFCEENRDISEMVITNEELKAITYLYNTCKLWKIK